MLGSEVRFAEEYKDECVGIAAAEFGDLVGSVAVASPDLAQVFARHAIEPINGGGAIARGGQQFIKRIPVVSPVEVKTDALAEFVFIDFAANPFIENVLIAGK